MPQFVIIVNYMVSNFYIFSSRKFDVWIMDMPDAYIDIYIVYIIIIKKEPRPPPVGTWRIQSD